MDENKNYYEILGITPNANDKEIKHAYKKLVKKWHPDLHNNSQMCLKKLKDINEAYDVLSNAENRVIYNQIFQANKNSSYSNEQQKEDIRQQTKNYNNQTNYNNSINSKYNKEYYSEFEKLINENKEKNCKSTFWDKFNILYQDIQSVNPIEQVLNIPIIVILAFFWHLFDIFARIIEYTFKIIF